MPIRVYIVEDHAVMRDMVVEYLGLSDDIEVCGVASSAETAGQDLASAAPTVVLLDLALPGRNGLDLLEEIRARWGTPCVVLSGHGEPSYMTRAMAAGATGYVLKGSPAEVPEAIRRAANGDTYVSQAIDQRVGYVEEAGGP